MTSRAFYGSLQWIPFLKKIFHIKLQTEEKRIVQKTYLFSLTGERKNKSEVPRLASAGQMPNRLGYRGTPCLDKKI